MDPALATNIIATAVLVVITLLAWVIIRRRAALIRVASRSGKPDSETRSLTFVGFAQPTPPRRPERVLRIHGCGDLGPPLGGLVAVGSAVGVALGSALRAW